MLRKPVQTAVRQVLRSRAIKDFSTPEFEISPDIKERDLSLILRQTLKDGKSVACLNLSAESEEKAKTSIARLMEIAEKIGINLEFKVNGEKLKDAVPSSLVASYHEIKLDEEKLRTELGREVFYATHKSSAENIKLWEGGIRVGFQAPTEITRFIDDLVERLKSNSLSKEELDLISLKTAEVLSKSDSGRFYNKTLRIDFGEMGFRAIKIKNGVATDITKEPLEKGLEWERALGEGAKEDLSRC